MVVASMLPGTTGMPISRASLPGPDLVAELTNGRWRRPNEGQPGLFAGLGEVGVFGEETVPGVHGIGTTRACHGDDPVGVEIALGRFGRANVVRLIGVPHVGRELVDVGIHGHGPDAEVPAGADNAQCDFSTVGDEDFREH